MTGSASPLEGMGRVCILLVPSCRGAAASPALPSRPPAAAPGTSAAVKPVVRRNISRRVSLSEWIIGRTSNHPVLGQSTPSRSTDQPEEAADDGQARQRVLHPAGVGAVDGAVLAGQARHLDVRRQAAPEPAAALDPPTT